MKKFNLTDLVRSLIHGLSKLGLALALGGVLALSVSAINDNPLSNILTDDSGTKNLVQANQTSLTMDDQDDDSDEESIDEWVDDVIASATQLVQDALGNGALLVNGLNPNQDVMTGASTVTETPMSGNPIVGVQDTTTGATGKTAIVTTYAPDGTQITTIVVVSGDDDDDDDDYYKEDDDDDENDVNEDHDDEDDDEKEDHE